MVFQQALDLRDESEELHALLAPLDDASYDRKTQFKDWTLHDIVAHLHIFNWAAAESIRDGDAFAAWYAGFGRAMATENKSMREVTDDWLDEHESGVRGSALLSRWRAFYRDFTDSVQGIDPKKRVKWAGPDMSVRSSLTARLMETWAHGQEIYDLLGVERQDKDRIQGVAVLGVNTFGWTFVNRGLDVPTDAPYVRLTAPSGAVWEWNEPSEANRVQGSATEFCQVVAQTRNIADTALDVVGQTATRWMSIAQCFAGAPQDPPAPGTRFRQSP
ncbi:MAG: TIGR03084 family metal-binding protein [Acidobacteriota bacterium]